MSDRMTTTKSFRTEDITCKPKRYQGGYSNDEDVNENISENMCDTQSYVVPPHAVTLESAIRYYEDNASGVYKTLYTQTALWLRTLLEHKKFAETNNSTSSEVNGGEIENEEA